MFQMETKGLLYYMSIKIEDLHISVALFHQLKSHNIHKLEELSRFTSDDIIRWRYLGRRSLEELIEIMKEYNIQFSE